MYNNSMNLPKGWYAIGLPSEFKLHTLNKVRRFGLNWVVWKKADSTWIMQEDRCPHRSARFSSGTLKNDHIVCPFHGFQFNSQGQCTLSPETGKAAPGLAITSFVLKEEFGYLWVAWGQPQETTLPWFSDLTGHWHGSQDVADWQQHFSRCVENQLDFSHLPFVHAKTIGRFSDPKNKPKIEKDKKYLKAIMNETPGKENYFEFRFPNVWRLKISNKMFIALVFVPVDQSNTRIYLRTYQNFVSLPLLRWLVCYGLKLSNRYILNEDKRIVIDQEPQDVRDPHHEILFPSDVVIQSFRRWLSGESL